MRKKGGETGKERKKDRAKVTCEMDEYNHAIQFLNPVSETLS